MPQTTVLDSLDRLIEQTEAFSPLFLELSTLRLDIAAAASEPEPWDDPQCVEARYLEWVTQQDHRRRGRPTFPTFRSLNS